jgi:hypothetical protein
VTGVLVGDCDPEPTGSIGLGGRLCLYITCQHYLRTIVKV